MLTFLILICLASPALSILGLLGFAYFPNEKIALILIMASFIFGKNLKINSTVLILSLSTSLLLALISVVRFWESESLNITDINMVYLFIALIFYFAYFQKNITEITDLIPKLTVIQLGVSIAQQTFMQLGLTSFAMALNNYPPQISYEIPITQLGLYRTTGLFTESSQYAAFLSFFAVCYFEGMFRRSALVKGVLILAFVDIIISQSVTAVIMIFAYASYSMWKRFNEVTATAVIIVTGASFFGLFFQEAYDKIVISLQGENEYYPRLLSAINNIKFTLNGNIFTGGGLSWENPSWDFLSVYFSGFGLLGLISVLFFLIVVIRKSNFGLILVFAIFLITNGNMVSSLNILVLSLLFASGVSAGKTSSSLRNARSKYYYSSPRES